MQLNDVLQVGEDALDVSRGQYVVSGDLLAEDRVQHLQFLHMGALRVEQLCRNNNTPSSGHGHADTRTHGHTQRTARRPTGKI